MAGAESELRSCGLVPLADPLTSTVPNCVNDVPALDTLAFGDRRWKPQTSVSPITGRFADNYLASAHTEEVKAEKPSPGAIAMIEAIVLSGEEVRPEQIFPALMNPAVAHCCAVHERVLRSELKKKKGSELGARLRGDEAYCRAMPPLSGYRNTCDFIACVGYGMLTGIITQAASGRLLYAAQVSLSTVAKESKTPESSAV